MAAPVGLWDGPSTPRLGCLVHQREGSIVSGDTHSNESWSRPINRNAFTVIIVLQNPRARKRKLLYSLKNNTTTLSLPDKHAVGFSASVYLLWFFIANYPKLESIQSSGDNVLLSYLPF